MGAPLAVLSVQNEPNWKVEYESAYWSGIDIRDFLKVMGQRFPQKGVSPGAVGIMAPEYENFDVDFNEMIQPSLADSAARDVLTHIGLHQYNGAHDASGKTGAKAFPAIAASGKRFWQTEVSGSGPYMPPGTGIDNALFYAKMIHHDMTLAETNAFLFWWLWTNNAGDFPGSLVRVNGGEVSAALRLYAMGQYSRFIRPGWRRIDSTTSSDSGIYSSAYRNPQTDEIAVVLINDTAAAVPVTLNLQGAGFASLKAWRTSANEKLAAAGDQPVSGGKAELNLPPQSISTFYGRVVK
jgi:O-glycosyl hydrolase